MNNGRTARQTIADVLKKRWPERDISEELPSVPLLIIPDGINETHADPHISTIVSQPGSAHDKVSHILALPPEITLKIISQLPLLARVALALTCKRLANVLTRHDLLAAHATSYTSTIFSLRSYFPRALVRYPSKDNPDGWTRLFFPELRHYEPHWEMAYCDPHPESSETLPLGTLTKIRYDCDDDFMPVNPFIVKVAVCQAVGGHSGTVPFVVVRAQSRHSKACQKDLVLCSSRFKYVRDGLKSYPEMRTYVTKGMMKEICMEMLVSAISEWDVSELAGLDRFVDFLERWFEREKVRVAMWTRRKDMDQVYNSQWVTNHSEF